MSPERVAVLSMDIEDWYHLDYFKGLPEAARRISMLDGLDTYLELLDQEGIRSSFFTLGEIADGVAPTLRQMVASGHDVSCHGQTHARPLTLEPPAFANELRIARAKLQDLTGSSVPGFRASCFSLDRQRLDIVRDAGFQYDSSKIRFATHPLYGRLDLTGFAPSRYGAYQAGNFVEFEVSTVRLFGKTVPISGGGYLRIFPWLMMRPLICRYLRHAELYVLYIHPFELSSKLSPLADFQVSSRAALRFGIGRATVRHKLTRLIRTLRDYGFGFSTFADLHARIVVKTANRKP